MINSYSYTEKKDSDRAKISIKIDKAIYSEWVSPEACNRGNFDIQIVLRGKAVEFELYREWDSKLSCPQNPVKIALLPSLTEKLLDVESKFPLGYFVFNQEEIYFSVSLRHELIEKIAGAIPSVGKNSLMLVFDLPYSENYEGERFYPILGYGVIISNNSLLTSPIQI